MKIVKTYITKDNRQFNDLRSAKIHEASVVLEEFVENKCKHHSTKSILEFIQENREGLLEVLRSIQNSMKGVK